MKKFFAILSLFLMPVRLHPVRLSVESVRSWRVPYR